MAEVVMHEQTVQEEDVQIPDEFNGGDDHEGYPEGHGSATPQRCIGTPSEPGSPERLVGEVGPSGPGFGEMDGQAMQTCAWVPAMGWDGMDFNMPIHCCGEFDSNMGVWAVQQVVDPSTGCTQWVVPIAAGQDCGGCCGDDGNGGYAPCDVPPDGGAACGEEGTDAAQMGEQYACYTGQTEDEEVSMLQKRMCDLERQRTQMQRSWERERENLLQELERYREVLRRYAIPAEEANDRALLPCFMSKDQQAECNMYGYYGYEMVAAEEEVVVQAAACGESSTVTPGDESGCSNGDGEDSTTKIASQLKAMFPGSKVCNWSDLEPRADSLAAEHERRRRRADPFGKPPAEGRRRLGALADAQVDELAAKLESSTRSIIDERALHALQALAVPCALEALTKVENLIEAQGGSCRNLSSILQSVCRKVERKGPRDPAQREKLSGGKPEIQVSSTEVSTPATTLPSPTEESQQKVQASTPSTVSETGRGAFPADSDQSDAPPAGSEGAERSSSPKAASKLKRAAARRGRERGEEVAGSDGESRARRWADIE